LPIYEFACQDCDHRFEELVRAVDPSAACPTCGSGRTARLMSAFSVRSPAAGGNDLARAMSQAGPGAGGGCCGGACGGH
jgi:putative FmdB family regulatory protein